MTRLADDLAAAVARRRRGGKKIEQAELWRLFREVYPVRGPATEHRRLLQAALSELRDRGEIRLGGHDGESPPLPIRIYRVDAPAERPAATPEPFHPALPGADRATDARGVLRAVSDWLFELVGRPEPETVPLRERALEITGDEKAFDGPLTPPLTLSVLRAERVVLPLHRIDLGEGPVLLVIENATTFESVRRVLDRAPGPVGQVGWGAGGGFASSVLSLLRDRRRPGVIRYFGDLDADGLRIPAASSELARQSGLPPVLPATGLYALLLHHGVSGTGRAVPVDRARELATWLEPEHRAPAEQVLTSGSRLAQEAVGRRVLGADDTWRDGLDRA